MHWTIVDFSLSTLNENKAKALIVKCIQVTRRQTRELPIYKTIYNHLIKTSTICLHIHGRFSLIYTQISSQQAYVHGGFLTVCCFINKGYALRQNMDNTDSDYLRHIKNNVMLDKNCTFLFNSVDECEVRKLLRSPPEHSSVGTDMMDSKVLGLAADYVYGPICHILNACLMEGVYPTVWKMRKKLFPYLKMAD